MHRVYVIATGYAHINKQGQLAKCKLAYGSNNLAQYLQYKLINAHHCFPFEQPWNHSLNTRPLHFGF